MIIHYECVQCGNYRKMYFHKHEEIEDEFPCNKCSKKMERLLSAPSSGSTQVIDNGVQPREVEVRDVVIEQEMDKLNDA